MTKMKTTKAERMATVTPIVRQKTPFTAAELPVLAAMFARSNMGMGHPTEEEVSRAKQGYMSHGSGKVVHLDLQAAVMLFCQRFMERDEDIRGFCEEAESWVETLQKDGKEETCRVHPDLCQLYFGKADPHVRLGHHQEANRRALLEKRQSRGRGRR